MGKNQPPPLSFRPPDELRAMIEAYAVEKKISRHAAVLELLAAGLKAAGFK